MLSQSIQYSLRIGAFLAIRTEGNFRSKELAQAANIPLHYSAKVLRKLVEAQILLAQKGRGGGFSLAQPPSNVRFRDLFAAVQNRSSVPACVYGLSKCDEANPCPLHFQWKELSSHFLKWAAETTLESVRAGLGSTNNRTMNRLFRIPHSS